ncbi:hypothetical protein P168DRAFT_295373 [Aspergillus campestris IBT 28561]|uniref:Uncharacterized protein n=1 Tax=Aspergillus campestris (strain IBT 28561) TaxID=1392248 RepID=A0A2I1DCP4_ASPC2|nr:uncharacterized protein P168DRAFT_295373 [Aspergillus campestris IBT 28561]PKY07643.1 hypothetical protein P168DRAFT_295373 [Aspergillus campestris IBT 28561]
MSTEHLELDAEYGALAFDCYVVDHWKDDSPEESQQQWERLVWEYQRLSLKERNKYHHRTQSIPMEITPTHVQILRTHQTIYERNLGIPNCTGIQTVWLRTCYDADVAEKYADMKADAYVIGDKVLDDPARYAFAEDWRMVLGRMPGITDFWGLSDQNGDGAMLKYRSGLDDGAIRAQYERIEDADAQTLALKALEFQALLYLVDREAIETGLIKLLWLDEHGCSAWENRVAPASMYQLAGALLGATGLGELTQGNATRGCLIEL